MIRILTQAETIDVLKKEKLCFAEEWKVYYTYVNDQGFTSKGEMILYTLHKGNHHAKVKTKAIQILKHLKNLEINCVEYQ